MCTCYYVHGCGICSTLIYPTLLIICGEKVSHFLPIISQPWKCSFKHGVIQTLALKAGNCKSYFGDEGKVVK